MAADYALIFKGWAPKCVQLPHAKHSRGALVTETRVPRTTVELPPPGAAAKVLLVDDDFAILDGVSEFLESEGFFVASASNGIDALNQLRSGLRVDAIVLDVMMPMMDGWDFRAEQLADPSLRDTPVVVISACGFARETLQHQFKAYEVLSKPLHLEGFLGALKDACNAPSDRAKEDEFPRARRRS
jgi:CheY-like chemotaxis protein